MTELTFTSPTKPHLQTRVNVRRIGKFNDHVAYYVPGGGHLRLHKDGRVFQHVSDGPKRLVGINGQRA